MSSGHIETRARVRAIATVESFEGVLAACTLPEEDKMLLRMHYLDGYDFAYIADALGYSESTIKKRHRKALAKISAVL